MAREAIVWTPEMDNKLRRYARCGWSIRMQSRLLNLCPDVIYKRRKRLGLSVKSKKI